MSAATLLIWLARIAIVLSVVEIVYLVMVGPRNWQIPALAVAMVCWWSVMAPLVAWRRDKRLRGQH